MYFSRQDVNEIFSFGLFCTSHTFYSQKNWIVFLGNFFLIICNLAEQWADISTLFVAWSVERSPAFFHQSSLFKLIQLYMLLQYSSFLIHDDRCFDPCPSVLNVWRDASPLHIAAFPSMKEKMFRLTYHVLKRQFLTGRCKK